MTGKLHIAPLAPATPTKNRPEDAPATPEAILTAVDDIRRRAGAGVK